MGVFPCISEISLLAHGLPHARGGVSVDICVCKPYAESSPRTWGCFFLRVKAAVFLCVFPTHVGVFPGYQLLRPSLWCLPHARGGVSTMMTRTSARIPSSPRTWGCFLSVESNRGKTRVFPTHVGVFLGSAPRGLLLFCLPHARGGVSRSGRACPVLALSSPRTWGGRQAGVAPESPFPTVGAFHVCP